MSFYHTHAFLSVHHGDWHHLVIALPIYDLWSGRLQDA
jgi:hypothetical protein